MQAEQLKRRAAREITIPIVRLAGRSRDRTGLIRWRDASRRTSRQTQAAIP